MLKHLQTVFDHKHAANSGLDLDRTTNQIQDVCEDLLGENRKIRRKAPNPDKLNKFKAAVGQVLSSLL